MRIPFTRYAIKRHNPALEEQYAECRVAAEDMYNRSHARYHIINALLEKTKQKRYLEIGVRNPEDNFDRINADFKISVDPGIETQVNQAIFPVTSDDFFGKLFAGELNLAHATFDVIFIDGLHLADQTYRDIQNALKVIADVGYIVMHDCSPPTIFHAREDFRHQGPATHFWNGTSWKAYQRFRTESNKRCFVVDVDWGVGVIVNHDESPENRLPADANPFYEYNVMASHRKQILNLCQVADVSDLSALH
jgi:hypothetical protein